MRRRAFFALVGGAAAWPLALRAQQPLPVIGFLSSASRESYAKRLAAFHRGLNETGYKEGQNVTIEYRWADNQRQFLPKLANDLVLRRVNLIVTTGGSVTAIAAKKATDTIPIVFQGGADPVKLGLVASLNRPGGNVTGATNISDELHAKRFELLREIIPSPRLIAVLLNPTTVNSVTQLKGIEAAARATGQNIQIFHAATEEQISAAFAAMVAVKADALLVAADSFFTNLRHRLVTLAARHALPTSYPFREYVHAGGLVCYGPNLADSTYRAGLYAGRILGGAKPRDLPVLQPTKFELLINLKTAKALRLTIPPTVLARADAVIE